MLEASSGGRDVFTWLSTDFCKSCAHNPTVHWIMRQWHWARLRYCNASDSYRFNCHWKLWMVDAERDGQKVSDQHASFLFQTFPFQAFFQGLEVNILSGENAASPIKCDDTFSKRKKAVYDQDSVSMLAFLQSVFCSLSSLFFFLSIQDDRPDKIDCSGIVSVVLAAEANAAADTLVNNCNRTYFPHS